MATSGTKTEKYLHMEFGMDNGKTVTVKLKDPKNDLEASAVKTWMDSVVAKSALIVGTALPNAANDAYIIETTKNVTDVDITTAA